MKEIVLPAFVLKEALPGLNKIVSRKSSLPVLQTVRLARDSEGSIHIHATDLDAYATYTAKEPLPGPVVDMLVPLEQLAKTIKTLKSEDAIGFIPEGKDKVKLRYSIGGSMVERTLNSLPVDEFPPMPKINQPSIALDSGFGVAVRQALECCSEDSSRRILNGVCLDVEDKKFHYVVGTNGRCLYSANSFCFDLKKSVVIPDSKFLEWTDLMDKEPACLSVEPGEEKQPAKDGKPAKEATTGWVKLQSGRWTFITKEIEGKFPNWKQVIPTINSKWTRVVLSEEAVKQLLLVTSNLPGDSSINRPVRLRVDKHLAIEGQNKDDEQWTSIPIKNVQVTGKPVTVALNRQYFLNALRFGLNQLEVEDSLSPAVFSKGGKKMVVMPVRMEDPTPVPAPQEQTSAPSAPTEQTTPPAQPEAPTEERTAAMPRKSTATETASTTSQATETTNGSITKSLVEHVDQIKDTLKTVIRDLSELADALKQAEKEKRTTEKEIEAVRTKLRQIQSVSI